VLTPVMTLTEFPKRSSQLAVSEGFEPPTPRFEVWCSIRLSYETRKHHKTTALPGG
jgi:hypothetical protein